MRGWRLEEIGRFCAWVVGCWILAMALWVAVPTLITGWQPSVISSGSMSPSLRAGDVVLIDRGSPVGEGDIIAFTAGDDTVVHRVVGATEEGALKTRGDANKVDDSGSLGEDRIIGRARLVVPFIGMPVLWGTTTILVAIGLLSIVATAVRSRPAAGVAVLVGTVAFATFTTTSGAWTRPTTVAQSSISTSAVAAPTGIKATCGAASPGSVVIDLSWDPIPAATNYRVLVDPPGGGTNYQEIATTPGDQTAYSHEINAGNGRYRFAVSSVVGVWESDPSESSPLTVIARIGRCR